jgi:hypothetical protein
MSAGLNRRQFLTLPFAFWGGDDYRIERLEHDLADARREILDLRSRLDRLSGILEILSNSNSRLVEANNGNVEILVDVYRRVQVLEKTILDKASEGDLPA